MTKRTRAVIFVILAMLIWSLPMVLAKVLTQGFDSWTQNFYRYLASLVCLLGLGLVRPGGLGFGRWRRFWLCLIPALANTIYQAAWVHAMYSPTFNPGQGALLSKTLAIYAAIFGFIFFADERGQILSAPYLLGLLAACLGTLGVVTSDPNWQDMTYRAGAFLVIFSSASWALYSVAMKKMMRNIDPITAFTGVCLFTALLFGILSVGYGNPGAILHVSWKMNLLLVGSGILCIGIGHPIFFYAVRELGVAVTAAVLLMTAILTPVLSYFVFGEVLVREQIVWGAVLLAGVGLTLRARQPQGQGVLEPAKTEAA